MRYKLQCLNSTCDPSSHVWIRGSYDASVNATELDDSDPNWREACEHILAGDYAIVDEESIDDEP